MSKINDIYNEYIDNWDIEWANNFYKDYNLVNEYELYDEIYSEIK